MSSNSRITRSKGPSDGTLLPPYTRPRKDTSTKADNAGSLQPSTQQQTACDQLNSMVSHSPFVRPGSRAGASTAPATPTGMPSASASPFARPGSRVGSTQSEVDFPSAAPQAARSSSCNSTILSIDDPVFPREANTSTSWDVIDPDCDEEVAGITNGQSQHQVNRPANANNDSDPFNQDLGLEQVSDTNSTNNLGTLYNQDFFIADTMNRRLSQIPNKMNYPSPVISGLIALIKPKHKKKKKKKKKSCRYTRLQPVYCQLIALTSNILSLAKSLIGISTVMLTPCLSFSISRRPPAFLVSY